MGKGIKLPTNLSNNPFVNPGGQYTDPLNLFGQADQAMGLGPKPKNTSAGGAPGAPSYETLRNTDGTLKDIFKFDPTKSSAFGQMQSQAMSTGPSAWAQLQGQRQGLEEQNMRDIASKQGLQAMNQANSMLARTGGLSSGAAGLAARANTRNTMLANQDISRQGMMSRLGIGQADEDRRQQLLGQVADTELSGQEKNLNTVFGDVQSQRDFDLNRYASQMQAWGAANTANAQAAAAAQTKKGKK